MNVVELLSTKGQSMIYIDDFCYLKKKSTATSIRWQCSKQRNGGCVVTTEVNRQNPRSFTPHDHTRLDDSEVENLKFRSRLRQVSQENNSENTQTLLENTQTLLVNTQTLLVNTNTFGKHKHFW